MTETKHTPGPYLTVPEDPAFIYTLEGDRNRWSCRVQSNNGIASEEEVHAVAALLRAAPAMLEALEAAKEACGNAIPKMDGGSALSFVMDAYDAACEALAAARGEVKA